MSDPIKEREKSLRSLVDSAIKNGWKGAKFKDEKMEVNERDIAIITPYCKSLGFVPSKSAKGLSIDPLPKDPPPPPEEKWDEISISLETYKYLKFCMANPICKFLYKFHGEK